MTNYMKYIMLFIAFVLIGSTPMWVPVYTDGLMSGTGTSDDPLSIDTSKVATTYDLMSAAGGASYDVYTALLTQSGTDDPVATVLENTLGGTVVWTRTDMGAYVGTLSGAFTANKTTPISQRIQQSLQTVDESIAWITGQRLTDNTYGIDSGNVDEGHADSKITNCLIEIRVYQ